MARRLDIRYQVYFSQSFWDRSLEQRWKHLSMDGNRLGLKKSWISCNINLVDLIFVLDMMHMCIPHNIRYSFL